MTPSIILGPPGTGKTTTLLGIVEGLLSDGVRPEHIAYIAFTRKAAREACDRACEKFNLSREDFKYFRTIHSFAFQQMQVSRDRLMNYGDYIELGKAMGHPLTAHNNFTEETLAVSNNKGDRLLFMEGLSRVTGKSLEAIYDEANPHDIERLELMDAAAVFADFKKSRSKLDFTDLLQLYIDEGGVPAPLRFLIVDEAQDLSRLQWRVVDKIKRECIRMWVAGDDDQAIFRWAGADIEAFIALEGDAKVLDQSYRVPLAIASLAASLSGRISRRREKAWKPRDKEGSVTYGRELDELDMDKGTWFLLARNACYLDQYIDHCLREGLLFTTLRKSPIDHQVIECVIAWERLRAGHQVSFGMAARIYDLITIKKGIAYGAKSLIDKEDPDELVALSALREVFGLQVAELIWHQALDRLAAAEVTYLTAALRRGEKLTASPRITIGTIHSVKGGEADNVVLCPDMAQRTWQEYQKNPDDEWRVWYVGATRSKDNLFVLNARGNRAVEL